MTIRIQIGTDDTLRDLERSVSELSRAEDEIQIWLPTDIGALLFKPTRIAGLIATAASVGDLSIVDWIENTALERLISRFGTTIEGLTAIAYARRIMSAKKGVVDYAKSQITWPIIRREGIVETVGLGNTLTFCAFDEDGIRDTPLALSDLSTKEKFTTEFLKIRKRYFEAGVAEGYSDRTSLDLFEAASLKSKGEAATGKDEAIVDKDEALAHFVFEIFQNSYEHGCLDSRGDAVSGLRYLTLRKHIASNKQDMVARAEGFPKLQEYLESVISGSHTVSFYEVAIADHGLGIIERFLASQPQYKASVDSIRSRVELVNEIVDKALTSKQNTDGAGHGLNRALTAVSRLRGFISVRTDRLWLYRSFSNQMDVANLQLVPTDQDHEFAKIAGTQFNLLFPLN